jgi:hypothetical protein
VIDYDTKVEFFYLKILVYIKAKEDKFCYKVVYYSLVGSIKFIIYYDIIFIILLIFFSDNE